MPTSSDSKSEGEIQLYNSINSDCSTRLRLALAWKGLKCTNIDCGSPFSHADRPPKYKLFNPTGAVPTLVCQASDGTVNVITQSVAAMEYLEEAYPSTRRLLPTALLERASARTLTAIIASDTHPLTAPRVTQQLKSQYLDSPEIQREKVTGFEGWRRHWIYQGLQAYEQMLTMKGSFTGLYSIGNEVSLADICLLPQAWRSQDYGISLDEFPTIKKIVANLEDHECLRANHWDNRK